MLSILDLTGCASTHDDGDGFNPLGGGMSSYKVSEGIYHIYERTNYAPWKNFSGARSAWQSKAEALCGSKLIRELGIKEYTFENIGAAYIHTIKEGYAICEGVKLSDEEVQAVIDGNSGIK